MDIDKLASDRSKEIETVEVSEIELVEYTSTEESEPRFERSEEGKTTFVETTSETTSETLSSKTGSTETVESQGDDSSKPVEATTSGSETEIVNERRNESTPTKYKPPCRCVDFLPYKIFLIGMYWLVFLGCGMGVSAISITLEDYHAFLNSNMPIDIGVVSLVFLIRGIAYLISGYFVGKLCDFAKNPSRVYHLNLHHVLAFSAFVMTVPLFLLPLVPYSFLSLPIHFFLGVGGNIMLLSTVMLPRALFKSDKITASVVQGCHFCFGFGAFIYPLIIGSTVFTFNWSSRVNLIVIYFIAAFVQAIPCLLFFLPCPVMERQKVEEIIRIRKLLAKDMKKKKKNKEIDKKKESDKKKEIFFLKRCFLNCYNSSILKGDIEKVREVCFKKKKKKKIDEVEVEEEEELSYFQKFKLLLKYKKHQFHFLRFCFIALAGIGMMIYNAQNKSFQNLIFLYSRNRGWTKQNAAYTNTVYFLCYSTARFLSMFVFLCISPSTAIFILEFGSLTAITLLNIFENVDLVVWICIGFAAFFNSPIFGAYTVIPRAFGIEPSAIESSVIVTFAGCGSLFPSLVGALMRIRNYYFVLSVNICACLMLIVYYFVYILGVIVEYRKKRKSLRLKKLKQALEVKKKSDNNNNKLKKVQLKATSKISEILLISPSSEKEKEIEIEKSSTIENLGKIIIKSSSSNSSVSSSSGGISSQVLQ